MKITTTDHFECQNKRPLISYITVCYNSVESITNTILSISRCKELFPCEYIIIDGNSNDGTEQILKRHEDLIDVLVREDDHGIYDAMNKGLRLARGDYICFVNSDDRVIPDGAFKIVKWLSIRHHRHDIVASAALAIDRNKTTLWLPSALDKLLVFRCPNLCHNGVYAHRSVFQRVGNFDPSFHIAADSDWIIRAVRNNANFTAVFTPTVCYRVGGVSKNTQMHATEMLQIAVKTFPLLRLEVIKSLFYHLFVWRDRKQLFTNHPMYSLPDAIMEAKKFYPELAYGKKHLSRINWGLVAKVCGKMRYSLRTGDF